MKANFCLGGEIKQSHLDLVMAMHVAIGKLNSQVEALQADAERYRWLREHNGLWQVQVAIMHNQKDDCNWVHANEGLDAVIDAARKDQP